jgi:putative cardiolipin synthase
MKNKTGVFVLEDGGTSMVARAWLCSHAEKSIDIQYFIFSTDNVGLIACDYLVRAADRGIKVRILVDDIMVEASEQDILTMDSHPNIEIRIYNPGINLGKNILQKIGKLKIDFRGANQRMHNKTFSVDGKISITGGRNVANEYFDYDSEYNFRDRDVLLIGKTVTDVENSFSMFWGSPFSVEVNKIVETLDGGASSKEKFARLHEYACDPANFWPEVREQVKALSNDFKAIQKNGDLCWEKNVSFVSDVPGKNSGEEGLGGGGVSTDSLIALVKHAKKSIDIQSPYLITTELGEKLFSDAVKRGVKIRILTNSLASTDNLEAFSGYQRCRKNLLKAGIRIFEFKPDAAIRKKILTGALQKKMNYSPVFGIHAKSMVIDGVTTVIGTFNLDPRSANLNCECITILRSQKISAGVLSGMEEEFKIENSWETTKDLNPDAFAGKKKIEEAMKKRVVPKGIL